MSGFGRCIQEFLPTRAGTLEKRRPGALRTEAKWP